MRLTATAEERYQFKAIPCVTFIEMQCEKGNSFYPNSYKAKMQGSFDFPIHPELIGYKTAEGFINCIRSERYALAAFSDEALTELFGALDELLDAVHKMLDIQK